jgi:hypothetical protein
VNAKQYAGAIMPSTPKWLGFNNQNFTVRHKLDGEFAFWLDIDPPNYLLPWPKNVERIDHEFGPDADKQI